MDKNSTIKREITKPDVKKLFSFDFSKLFYSLVAIGFGLMMGVYIIIALDKSPADFFKILWDSSFSTNENIGNFFANFSWILALGLAMVVSFRAGLFNIGSAGQFIIGGFVGYIFAFHNNLGAAGIPVILLIGGLVGGVIGLLIGWLKTQFNIHEVISSIMINWILFWVIAYLTKQGDWGWTQSGNSGTDILNAHNALRFEGLSNIFGSMTTTKINVGIIVVPLIVIVLIFMYKFTTWGYKQDIIGSNPNAVDYIGISKTKETLKVMFLSGALAGLAGVLFYVGSERSLPNFSTDFPMQAFDGIIVSLIGFNTPLGAVGAAMFLSTFKSASGALSGMFDGTDAISNVIIAIIIIAIAVSHYLIKYKPLSNFFRLTEQDLKEAEEGSNKNNNLKEQMKKVSLPKIKPKSLYEDKIKEHYNDRKGKK